jgi:methionyl-tRNA formyltransferase
MKIIFAGTPKFASQHLEIVLESNHEVLCVLTQPDRRSGRGKKVNYSPVKELATKKNIKILQPNTLKDQNLEKNLIDMNADIILVVAYGLLVPKNILDIPKFGCINVHGSLLPRWRGASPMEYSILEGDKKSGLSYMQMSEGLDEGPVYETHECSINHQDSLGRLEEKLIALSKENLNNFLGRLEKGQLKPKDQDNNLATFAPKISKEILQLDWVNQKAQKIICKINAFEPKYGAYFLLGGKRIKIHKAKEITSLPSSIPGTMSIFENEMIISCKDATSVQIEIIQMEGKNKVSGQEFITAYEDLIKSHKKIEFTTR